MFRLNLSNKPEQPSSHFSLERDINPVIKKYYPKLLPAVHATLTVFATLALKNRTKPLSLIFEASSGLGKTAVLQMSFPPSVTKESPLSLKGLSENVSRYVYRSDKFTPKAFVTHAANVKRADLEKIDLLPKLRNKVLVTKELAPIFRGRETELQDNFSILISILDGKGFTSDSGMRGSRGYKESIIFNWIGATTPLPASTHRLMSQLGTRLLFFEVSVSQPTREDLMAYAERNDKGKAEVECNLAITKFIVNFFRTHPRYTVESDSIVFPKDLLSQLVDWADFLVKARSEVKYENTYSSIEPVAALPPEGAWKVVDYFKELARGHALIHGRKEIVQEDLDLVAHVAISSVPGHLRPLIKALRNADYVDARKGEELCAVSRPTIGKYFAELEVLEIVKLEKGKQNTNQPERISLVEEYRWLRG